MRIPTGKPEAMAHIRGNDNAPMFCGSVMFYQMCQGVLVVAELFHLPETGIFALHIYDRYQCADHSSGHYDPMGVPQPMHAGDLPPVFSCEGRAFMAFLTNRLSLTEIYGKTLILHFQPDEFATQPTGSADECIGCGIIMAL